MLGRERRRIGPSHATKLPDAESEGPRKTREEKGTSRGNEKAGVGDESVVQHLEQLECGGDEFIERV